MRRKKRWLEPPANRILSENSVGRHPVPELVAQILINRGLSQEQDIISFLDPTLSRLLPPAGLQDLTTAARRLAQAVDPAGNRGRVWRLRR